MDNYQSNDNMYLYIVIKIYFLHNKEILINIIILLYTDCR